MIGAVLLALRHRWRRALTVGILAAVTFGIAAALPGYLAAGDRAMIAGEVRHARADELTVSATQSLDVSAARDRDFENGEPARLAAPWLSTTFSVAIDVDTAAVAPGSDPRALLPKLLYRQGYCAHVVILAGRCPQTAREVIVDADTAARLGVAPGGQFPLWWAKLTDNGWLATDSRLTVSVVGVWRPADESDPWWGTAGWFTNPGPTGGRTLPILTERGTVDSLAHDTETQYVDALLRPGAVTAASIPAIRRWIAGAKPIGETETIGSGIPALLDRVDRDREALRELLPDVAAALAALGCLTLFLVVSHGVAARGGEVGVVRLRGTAVLDRWTLLAGESLVPVMLGIPAGVLLGRLLAAGLGAATLPAGAGPGAFGTGGSFGLAVIGALLVTVAAAHVRTLSARVVDVLRRVPARTRGWRATTAQALAVALAAAAVAQLHLQDGPLTGIMIVAPALVVIAAALVAGPLVLPLAVMVARRTLAATGRDGDGGGGRNGGRGRDGGDGRSARSAGASTARGAGAPAATRRRLGTVLGAVTLARRPGAHLLLSVQVAALGLVGFAVAHEVSARQARAASVELSLGAPRVLDTGPVSPADLLREVRAADPTGRYAMAVVAVPRLRSADPPAIAVDSPRLAAVATWPADAGAAPDAVAATLRPVTPDPVTLSGRTVSLRMDIARFETDFGDAQGNATGSGVRLEVVLETADRASRFGVPLGVLQDGDHVYRTDVPACAGGCRLAGFTATPLAGTYLALDATLRAVGTDAGPVDVPFGDSTRWTAAVVTGNNPPTLTGTPDGLGIRMPVLVDVGGGLRLTIHDGPGTLPLVAAGPADPGPLDVPTTASRVAALPGVGTRGAMMDLDYLVRLTGDNPIKLNGEVWLAAGTPESVVTALRVAGVVAQNDRTATGELAYLDGQGPALGAAASAAAALGAVLLAAVCAALMAGTERDDRAAELRALRRQGLAAGSVRRAARVGHLGLVALAALAGTAVGGLAWWLTRDRLPVFADGGHTATPTTWAPWWWLALAVAAAALVLAAGALLAAGRLAARAVIR